MGSELGDDQEPEGQKAKAKENDGLENEREEFAAHGIQGSNSIKLARLSAIRERTWISVERKAMSSLSVAVLSSARSLPMAKFNRPISL